MANTGGSTVVMNCGRHAQPVAGCGCRACDMERERLGTAAPMPEMREGRVVPPPKKEPTPRALAGRGLRAKARHYVTTVDAANETIADSVLETELVAAALDRVASAERDLETSALALAAALGWRKP